MPQHRDMEITKDIECAPTVQAFGPAAGSTRAHPPPPPPSPSPSPSGGLSSSRRFGSADRHSSAAVFPAPPTAALRSAPLRTSSLQVPSCVAAAAGSRVQSKGGHCAQTRLVGGAVGGPPGREAASAAA